jgi:hypothetical protein
MNVNLAGCVKIHMNSLDPAKKIVEKPKWGYNKHNEGREKLQHTHEIPGSSPPGSESLLALVKRRLQILAMLLAVTAVLVWLTTGANRGWTKTSVPVKTLDEVTGIEAIAYRQQFVPGVDFLGIALLGAGILAGVSLFFRNKPTVPTQP